MASFSVVLLSMALFIGSAITFISPATAPSTSVSAPTPFLPSVSPSPSLSVVKPPASVASPSIIVPPAPEPIGSPPSPPTTLIAFPPSDGFAPAPAPNGAILNEVTLGSFYVGFLAVALSV